MQNPESAMHGMGHPAIPYSHPAYRAAYDPSMRTPLANDTLNSQMIRNPLQARKKIFILKILF